MDIGYFLKLMTEKNASDMFLTTGAPVYIKIEGKLYPLGNTGLPPGMVKKIAYSLMDEGQVPIFERELELNMALALQDAGRFRINVFKQRGEVGMVIRAIRSVIPTIEELNLPQVLKDIIMTPRGLVLLVGSTGSGKSTSLASMIDHRNSTTTGHILTIEDPIEYLHKHKQSIVNQREVGLDTHAFHNALKNAMREAPDVILIGEILDATTMEAAIAFAETGHLCLATLHSNNADQTIEPDLRPLPGARRTAIAIGEDHRHFTAVLVAELAWIEREQRAERAWPPLLAFRRHVGQPFCGSSPLARASASRRSSRRASAFATRRPSGVSR